ncbi:erythromycin esterase family protein [Winogradskyella sp. A2]|uniref:erythromycin esterase family protein n=1 Tax=Winogradskyella sp. A2 TaxID=3366944 RepID=UPI00398C6AC6
MKTNLFFLLLLLFSCTEKSADNQVEEWISKHAVPIKTVQPRSGFEDLKTLKEMVEDARIVSLGEPTHGNKEVFQLKHRMIEYFVEEMGFNIFALECPFGEAYDINRYVLDGIGEPEKALAGIYMWAWDTQEVLDLIKWMREYNADPSHETKVKFYGFDTQNPERASRVMLDYLAKVDPTTENSVRPELGQLSIPFSNPELIGNRQWIPEEGDSSSLKAIKLVMESFDKNKNQYIQTTSISEWEIARQHTRQVEMYIEQSINDAENWSTIRDLGQAQNLKWIMDHEGDDSKMVVWAHNSHVSNSSRWGIEWMGSYMKKWYGNEIKIFGFLFNQGSFRAIDEGVPSKGMYDFSMGMAKKGTLENIMTKTRMNLAVIDLTKLPKKGDVYDWFNQERPTRNSGGGYNENNEEHFYWPYNLAKAYDALVYLDSTSAVVDINDSDYDHMWLITKKLNQPTNTDFENNNPGEVPDGWVAWSKFQRLGVKMTVSKDDAYSGKNSAIVNREKGLKYGEITSNLRQYIDATPYRGKRIQLKVAAKAEIVESNFAFLRLSIDPDPLDDAHEGLPPLFDSLDKCRVESNEWKTYEIETDVDENANIIHYGIYLRDFGTVWIDDVEIKIIN